MSQETSIKNKILEKLETLLPDILREIQLDDFKTDFLMRNTAQFPVAIVTPSTIDSVMTDNRDNLRTYTFEVLIVEKGENITDNSDMEDLREAVMNLFDNDPTLSGLSDGGVEPTSSLIAAFSHIDKSFVGFSITLKPKALINLNY